MTATRPADDPTAVIAWSAETEADEVGQIVRMIDDLSVSGVAYRDMAVLVRSRAAYPELLNAFAAFDIPVQPGGRTGLFAQSEARLLGHTFCCWRGSSGGTPADLPKRSGLILLLTST